MRGFKTPAHFFYSAMKRITKHTLFVFCVTATEGNAHCIRCIGTYRDNKRKLKTSLNKLVMQPFEATARIALDENKPLHYAMQFRYFDVHEYAALDRRMKMLFLAIVRRYPYNDLPSMREELLNELFYHVWRRSTEDDSL
jgi:hypothetical protein